MICILNSKSIKSNLKDLAFPFFQKICRLSRIENVLWPEDNWIEHVRRPPLYASAPHLLCVSAADRDFFKLQRENSETGIYWSVFSRASQIIEFSTFLHCRGCSPHPASGYLWEISRERWEALPYHCPECKSPFSMPILLWVNITGFLQPPQSIDDKYNTMWLV